MSPKVPVLRRSDNRLTTKCVSRPPGRASAEERPGLVRQRIFGHSRKEVCVGAHQHCGVDTEVRGDDLHRYPSHQQVRGGSVPTVVETQLGQS